VELNLWSDSADKISKSAFELPNAKCVICVILFSFTLISEWRSYSMQRSRLSNFSNTASYSLGLPFFCVSSLGFC